MKNYVISKLRFSLYFVLASFFITAAIFLTGIFLLIYPRIISSDKSGNFNTDLSLLALIKPYGIIVKVIVIFVVVTNAAIQIISIIFLLQIFKKAAKDQGFIISSVILIFFSFIFCLLFFENMSFFTLAIVLDIIVVFFIIISGSNNKEARKDEFKGKILSGKFSEENDAVTYKIEVEKWNKLYADGIISETELERKKQDLVKY